MQDSRNSWVRRWTLAAACAPLALVMGCPKNQPSKVPAQATAPTVTQQPANAPAPAATTQTAAQIAENMARAQKTQQLINRVEQTYRNGVDNYRAGHLEAARQDFDFAVDTMLTSGMDLKSDPQLSDEFEHLLDAINSLEIAALKQGN
ncbi:MAG TPA: lytic transglycosylase, partial [Edaphobacter sp.]